MVFKSDMVKTVKRILDSELSVDLTDEEVHDLSTQVVEAIGMDHDCVEDDEDEDYDPIKDEMDSEL